MMEDNKEDKSKLEAEEDKPKQELKEDNIIRGKELLAN